MPSDLFLLDTSVWIEVLPRQKSFSRVRQRVDALLAADCVATTGVVRLELLGGTKTDSEFHRLSLDLSALHNLPLEEKVFDEAARLSFQLRRQGVTVPYTDLLIAAVAIWGEAVLVHRDTHFDVIAKHSPLRVESHLVGSS